MSAGRLSRAGRPYLLRVDCGRTRSRACACRRSVGALSPATQGGSHPLTRRQPSAARGALGGHGRGGAGVRARGAGDRGRVRQHRLHQGQQRLAGHPRRVAPEAGHHRRHVVDALWLAVAGRKHQKGRAVLVRIGVRFAGSAVRARLTAKRRELGRVVKRAAKAGTLRVRVPLNRRGRAALRRAKRLKLTVTVRVTTPAAHRQARPAPSPCAADHARAADHSAETTGRSRPRVERSDAVSQGQEAERCEGGCGPASKSVRDLHLVDA